MDLVSQHQQVAVKNIEKSNFQQHPFVLKAFLHVCAVHCIQPKNSLSSRLCLIFFSYSINNAAVAVGALMNGLSDMALVQGFSIGVL